LKFKKRDAKLSGGGLRTGMKETAKAKKGKGAGEGLDCVK